MKLFWHRLLLRPPASLLVSSLCHQRPALVGPRRSYSLAPPLTLTPQLPRPRPKRWRNRRLAAPFWRGVPVQLDALDRTDAAQVFDEGVKG